MMKKGISIAAAVLCAVMCMTMTVSAAEPLAQLTFDNQSAVSEVNLKEHGFGSKNDGYTIDGKAMLFASVNGTDLRKIEWSKDPYEGVGLQPAMTGGNNNPWGEGAYLEVRVPTTGYEQIAFSADLGATKKGPRDYQLQYSLDGVNFTNVGEVYTLSDNKTMEQAFVNAALPADAANAPMVYIRVAVASNETVGGEVTLAGLTGGETAINNIVIAGERTAAAEAKDNAGASIWLWILIGAGALVLIGGATAVIVVKKKK